MGTREKLIKRIKLRPKDFTFDEAEKLLGFFSYVRSDKGKTSGSRVIFKNDQYPPILLHKTHPQKELKYYQIKQLADFWNRRDSYEQYNGIQRLCGKR